MRGERAKAVRVEREIADVSGCNRMTRAWGEGISKMCKRLGVMYICGSAAREGSVVVVSYGGRRDADAGDLYPVDCCMYSGETRCMLQQCRVSAVALAAITIKSGN